LRHGVDCVPRMVYFFAKLISLSLIIINFATFWQQTIMDVSGIMDVSFIYSSRVYLIGMITFLRRARRVANMTVTYKPVFPLVESLRPS